MRQIKFRGLCDNGIMRYGRLSQDKENSTMYYETHSQRICWDCSNIPVSNISLGQFTGMIDKNGFQIYEGDIIRNEQGDTSFIVYSDFAGHFDTNSYYGGGVSFFYQENEVIGNIHEKSVLLTQ